MVCCEYLAADGVLVSGALLQDGFEWREGFRRAPCVARLSVDVRNLELHRREDVSDVLLRLDANTNDRNVTLLPKVEALVVFGGGETVRHLLVRHVRLAGELARPCSHAPRGAVGGAVAVEVEAVRKGRFVEEVGGQIVLKIWEGGTRGTSDVIFDEQIRACCNRELMVPYL